MAVLNFTVSNNWGSGFVGNITLGANLLPLSGWTVSFAAPFQISSIWGAEIVSYTDGIYTVRNLSWNAQVGLGGSTSFGFVASGPSVVTDLRLGGSVAPPPAPVPVASIADAQITEGDSGTAEMVFTVSLSTATTGPVRLAWATQDGTAGAGADYVAASGAVEFAAGETTKTIRVAIQGDRLHEASESFGVTLSAPSGATLGRAQALGTIVNNDAAPSLTVDDVSVLEGNTGTTSAVFAVRLDQASGLPVTVAWTTADGT
ncbi:MAG TPA: Calx-beta domain-containing protein, partial [Roseococcus sp.]|nr:Calx-beta domain-containing protein [Roseococcus sp.]